MFAVLGITGNVGGAVARTLLAQGHKVRGIVRNPAKAQSWADQGVELLTADYDDALTAAFSGVEGVFAMIPPNVAPEPGFRDSIARIAALKQAILAANPPKACFLSSIGSEKSSKLGLITPSHTLEEELSATGTPSAFLRAGSFMENILHSIPAAKATGKYFAFYQPLDQPYPLIATEDIGRIAAETLLQSWSGNRFLELSGPEYYSSNQVALALQEALGKPITPIAVPRETWVEVMAQNGLPANRSAAYIEMNDSFNAHWIDFGVPGTEHHKGTIDLLSNVRLLIQKAE